MTQTKSEFMQWCDELEANGYHILWAHADCPTELQGFLPDGEVFYFRARGSIATFEVGFDNLDAQKWAQVYEDVIWGTIRLDQSEGMYAYSWLSLEEAQALFKPMLQEYRQTGIVIGSLAKPTNERILVLKQMLMVDLAY